MICISVWWFHLLFFVEPWRNSNGSVAKLINAFKNNWSTTLWVILPKFCTMMHCPILKFRLSLLGTAYIIYIIAKFLSIFIILFFYKHFLVYEALGGTFYRCLIETATNASHFMAYWYLSVKSEHKININNALIYLLYQHVLEFIVTEWEIQQWSNNNSEPFKLSLYWRSWTTMRILAM